MGKFFYIAATLQAFLYLPEIFYESEIELEKDIQCRLGKLAIFITPPVTRTAR